MIGIPRRQFVRGAVGSALLLGFPFVRAMAAGEVAGVLDPVVARMKETCRRGVIVAIPEDGKAAFAIEGALGKLLTGTQAEVQRVFCEGVFGCVGRAEIEKRLGKRGADENIFLIDEQCGVVEALKFDWSKAEANFGPELTALLHGQNDARLQAGADAQRKALADGAMKVDLLIGKLGSDEFADRAAAVAQLVELAPRASAILAVALAAGKEPEPRARLSEVFAKAFAAGQQGDVGPHLPFGAKWLVVADGGCGPGAFNESGDLMPAPACGLALARGPSKLFLRFLTRKR